MHPRYNIKYKNQIFANDLKALFMYDTAQNAFIYVPFICTLIYVPHNKLQLLNFLQLFLLLNHE